MYPCLTHGEVVAKREELRDRLQVEDIASHDAVHRTDLPDSYYTGSGHYE
jgi:hypothetical protein